MDQANALARMAALCRRRRLGFQLEYDVDYGIDRREGWTVTVDGSVIVQFAKTPEEALLAAIDRIAVKNVAPGTELSEIRAILEDNPCHHREESTDPDCVLCAIRAAAKGD